MNPVPKSKKKPQQRVAANDTAGTSSGNIFQMQYLLTPAVIRLQALGAVPGIERTIRKIRGPSFQADTERVLDAVEALLSKDPMQPGTKRHAAIHEAGHLAGYENQGMAATSAVIEGRPFGHGSWGGWASYFIEPCIEPGPWISDPNDFLRMAKGIFTGPLAEGLLANGHTTSAIGELTEAKLLTSRAAQLLGQEEDEVLRETLMMSAAIVERYANEIEELASLLMRRRRINRTEPSTRKILERVQRVTIAADRVSKRSREIVGIVQAALPRVDELFEVP